MSDRVTLLAFIKKQITKHGSQAAYAKHLGISQQYLNDVLHGRRDISSELAQALGYERLTIYVKSKSPLARLRTQG